MAINKQIVITFPETEEWMTWKAPLPADMQHLLTSVREDSLANPDFD